MIQSRNIKYGVHIVDPRTREGLVGQVYAQSQRDLLAVPEPVTLHSASPPILAGAWAILRETLLAGHVARRTKEALATAISDLNHCPWCVEAHSISLYALQGAHIVDAITSHEEPDTLTPPLADLLKWAWATLSAGAAILREPPFTSAEAAEIIGTAVNFHYLNRMVNALLVSTPLPGKAWLHKPLQKVLGAVIALARPQTPQPGASLAFLPPADLPADLAWAAGSPAVAGAFARFAFVTEQAGQQALSPAVRELVCRHAQTWTGAWPPLSRGWVEDAIRSPHLSESDTSAARLALLALRAPFQIDEGVVAAFRREHDNDAALIGALAWSAFSAARRIGNWLWE